MRLLLLRVAACSCLALAWLWTSVAIYYSDLPWFGLRLALAWTVGLGGPLALALRPGRRKQTLAVLLGVVASVAFLFVLKSPTNDGDWLPELVQLSDAVVSGDTAHITSIRNFAYSSASEYEVGYYDKDFDLSQLKAVDLIFSFWDGNVDIAHTMLSFDFGGEDVLCLSVEVRREVGESFGGLPGAFKQFEIIYVLGDERDLVRQRTNQRKEDVFLFRTAFSTTEGRQLLEHILAKVHRLNTEPSYYRTFGNNCTTALVDHVNAIWPNRIPYTKKIFMNGYAPEQGYERGMLRSTLPFEEYKALCNINDAAQAADEAPDFSRRIRSHLPTP